jgi:hypothetical protein
MIGAHSSDKEKRQLVIEAWVAGTAYAAGLCWISVCFVATFQPNDLSSPYWREIPGLRTDTCGIVAFFVTGVCLGTSEYLRLHRRRGVLGAQRPRARQLPGGWSLIALVASETVTVMATGLFVYLSANAVTHPVTLNIQAMHWASWPTEGTLRVIALGLCLGSVTALRYLLAGARPVAPPTAYMPP